MFFWKKRRNKSTDEVIDQMNQDYDKSKWLKKVLEEKEWIDFNLAFNASYFYNRFLRDREPHWRRPVELKRLIRDFRRQVKTILKDHPNAKISERDQQVEKLIRDANYDESYDHAPSLYYYFRTLTNEERQEWRYRMKLFSEKIVRKKP